MLRFLPTLSLLLIFISLFHLPVSADTKLSIVLTSNLHGRFSVESRKNDGEDPMLLLAQSLLYEKEKRKYDLYLDLGNAFHPGILSRYSFGSVMIDFFDYFGCDATLISSRDISIGLANLDFLSKGRKTKLLSSNILMDDKPAFEPFFVVDRSGKKIGFIGVSSFEALFDIADRKTLNLKLSEYRETIGRIAGELRGRGCEYVILLSGLSYRGNLELMESIPGLDLVISGGDSSGSLFSVPSSRIDLEWGRSIVTLLRSDGFYRLELRLGEGIRVESMKFNPLSSHKTDSRVYTEFLERLEIWKDKFNTEENREISGSLSPADINDITVSSLLRDRYRCEVGIVEKYSVTPSVLSGVLYSSSITGIVNDDSPVFLYRLRGDELKKVAEKGEELVITGLENGKVQNYAVADSRTYSVCSTQFAYDRVSRILRRPVKYSNTWLTLRDEIESDLRNDKKLTGKDFDYLNDRFRVTVDLNMSNFYDRSIISRGETIETPPGKPEETYRRWGMEDTLNITLYNRNHQLVLTSYIYFIKQNEEYLQNLLRGTLLYTYDPNSRVRPYHKSQVDTVLVDVEGRPVLARETIGFSYNSEILTGKGGAGFEKQMNDPEETALYGFEALLDLNYPVTENISYIFKLDSFVSLPERSSDKLRVRAEVTNSLSLKINSILGVSLKYKWFRLYSKEIEESYRYSQTLLSLDIKTDFKFF